MSWRSLLQEDEEKVMPWTGGRQVSERSRRYAVEGKLPEEHGWHRFKVGGGRRATWVGAADPDPEFDVGREVVRGYLVGNRLIPDAARIEVDPAKLVSQTVQVRLVERGLERFSRAVAARDPEGPWIFVRAEFPLGPESEVALAFAEGRPSVDHVKGVVPALDLAFRFCARERELLELARQAAERERAEAEQARIEGERRARVAAAVRDGDGRRRMAVVDFEAAARAALALSGATYLDHRAAPAKGEVVVQYRFRNQRFECVVEEGSLRVVDAGICLVDHRTGERGDTRFTLESLPAVVGEAMDDDVLVVFRHVD